jgi:hypothetical protein
MQRSLEQRIAIKFCVKLGMSAVENFPMIKTAFGDDYLSECQVYQWHRAITLHLKHMFLYVEHHVFY